MTATDLGRQPKPQSAGFSLFDSLLGGLLGQLSRGRKLTEAFQGPTGFDSVDDVVEARMGVDAEDEAVVHEGECGSDSLAAPDGSCEENVANE